MEALKRKRGPLRAAFTRTVNAVKDELKKHEIQKGFMADKLVKLETIMQELKNFDKEILDLLACSEGLEDAELNEEYASCEGYLDEYITVKRLVNERIDVKTAANSDDKDLNDKPGVATKEKKYKLPKIEIQKFDGELIHWLGFWSQFKKIHEDPELENCDKFHYLVQSMQMGTRARELVDSYPMTSENYESAVNALEKRFGKKELLIEVYVRELLRLIISNVRGSGKNCLPLAKLFDKVESYLRALESMGIKQEVNASWLFPMVESCLTEDIIRAWQRSTLFGREIEEGGTRLADLMEFLRGEIESEERLELARSGFTSEGESSGPLGRPLGRSNERYGDRMKRKSPNTAAALFTVKNPVCVFCNKSHETRDCYAAHKLSVEEKMEKLRKARLCYKCFSPGHQARFCEMFFMPCQECARPHHVFLCPELEERKEGREDETHKKQEVLQSNLTAPSREGEIALMTVKVLIEGKKGKKIVRALIDGGSQVSYILSSTAAELGLEGSWTQSISHTLFGGVVTEPKRHQKYLVKVYPEREFSGTKLELEFLDHEVICGEIPSLPRELLLKHLRENNVWLSDLNSCNEPIELLIGSNLYGKIITGRVKQLEGCGLTAIHTKLGWTVCGQIEDSDAKARGENVNTVITNLSVRDMRVSDLWNLESIGIQDAHQNMSKAAEEEIARDQFLNSLSRNRDGRYCVGLPWLGSIEDLPSNRVLAEKRLFSVTRKLKSLEKYEQYDEVFKEWIDEGVVEEVPEAELNFKGHYLPHHPVFKPGSVTTKIRPVFDASCKTGRSPSLNDCLYRGPNLIEEIPSILMRFRENCTRVTSDIRRAFLQIELKKEDRDYLRFLWWEKDNTVKVLRHTRVVFGVTSSPFLLVAVIAFHLSQVPREESLTAQKLNKSFYVDNCVTSVTGKEEAEHFISQSTEIMSRAKMELRMWQVGPIDESEYDLDSMNLEDDFNSSTLVLGLKWDRKNDKLKINLKLDRIPETLTKRNILSLTQGIFNPIGFLAPVLIIGKLLIQKAWISNANWDAPLSNEIQRKYRKWYEEIGLIADLEVPRRLGLGDQGKWSLHVFCDASEEAYAAVLYLRSEDQEKVEVQLVAAKSRVSPVKRMTIPRLELLACVIGARLGQYAKDALNHLTIDTYLWTDSATALAWIKRNDNWGTFVGNRVREICQVSDPERWFYIPGKMNPADLPSRGCSPSYFMETKWWEGPVWLKSPKELWPNMSEQTDESLVAEERKRGAAVQLVVTSETPGWYTRFSKFSKIVRIYSWMRRFIRGIRNKIVPTEKELSLEEREEAEMDLWRLTQKQHFSDIATSAKGLLVVMDDKGLYRVKTKIVESDEDFAFRYPILLPANNHLTKSLIEEFHLRNCHAGVQVTAAKLREKYWLIAAKREIRKVTSRCIICQRFTAKALSSPPIHLPVDRVRPSLVFEVTGIDYCGPLFLKNRSKVWIVLFTCAVYRAIHLELASTLSTETFMQTLRRFIARRGRPSTIYTDNGTNFVGAHNALKHINWQKVETTENFAPIKWKFIPPTAAWWERLIRSVKELLLRVLGRTSLNFEELSTVLCDVETTINSRPLTYMSDGPEELMPITPVMFLQDVQTMGVPDLDQIDQTKFEGRLRYCQTLRKELRSRFRKEYLGQLVQKASEKCRTVKVGDVVLVELDSKRRLEWPIARVIKILPSRDGAARVAKVKTATGTLVRPLKRLYLLEVSTEGDPIVREVERKRSRSGRLLKMRQ